MCEDDCNTWGPQDVTQGKWEVSVSSKASRPVSAYPAFHSGACSRGLLPGGLLPGLQFSGTPLSACPGCFVGQMGQGGRQNSVPFSHPPPAAIFLPHLQGRWMHKPKGRGEVGPGLGLPP